MAERIVIERLEFYGRCGVTEEERRKPQLIVVDLELDAAVEAAAVSDRLSETIDYAQVAERIVALSTSLTCQLLETLAEQLVGMLFAEFSADRVRIWIRKVHAPLAMVAGSVGIRFERTRAAHQSTHQALSAAPFLIQQLARLPKGHILDVAAGRGRNALYLLAQGSQVEAIDRDTDALSAAFPLACPDLPTCQGQWWPPMDAARAWAWPASAPSSPGASRRTLATRAASMRRPC